MSTWAVIVAGGSGTRYGRPKHTLDLGGQTLWERCRDTFESVPDIDGVIVFGEVPGGVPAGDRRSDSDAAGLQGVPADTDWVLVHDAARPLVTVDLIRRVLARATDTTADGVVPANPVTDTIKRVEGTRVISTVDRSDLVAVQTPQAFRLEILKRAHTLDTEDAVTDDAGLVERAGGVVVSVPGEATNIKITYDGDLLIAASFLEYPADA
jgi:2-C-methyl-D-erythritol 4-phosphate cytidylyltransferase